jgi:ATP-dependent RNA helicase DDX54/DBP10
MGKRRFSGSSESSSSQDDYSDDSFLDEDNEIDISSSLTSKKTKLAHPDEDEELGAFLQESIVKRNMKEGTDLLKKTRGKTKLIKGEVGGGSFQSMGE